MGRTALERRASRSSTDHMDVLVIESSPGIAATLEHRLVARRPRSDLLQRLPWRAVPGVESNETCPLTKHIDVAVLARQRGAEPSLNEMGSVCAAATSRSAGDPVSGRRVRTRSEHRDRRSRRSARGRGRLRRGGSQAARSRRRRHHRARASTNGSTSRSPSTESMSAQTISRLADRARQAVRDARRHTPVVDISVVEGEPADRLEPTPYHECGESPMPLNPEAVGTSR